MKNKIKIRLIHNMVTPTRTKLFNELYKKLKEDAYDFKIIFTSETEWNRARDTSTEIKKFKFPYKILKSKQITNKTKTDQNFFHINKDIIKEIEKENPDTIIHAWRAGLSAFQTCHRAKKHKKRFVLWSGSTKYEKSRRRTITKPLVKRLVKNSTSYRSYGTRASEYLESLGANPKKIFKLYNTIDIDFFIQQAEELKPQKEQIKKELWIKEKNSILFVWRLVQGKWVFELLEWFSLFQEKSKDFALIFVGSWPEEEALKKIVEEKSISSVYFMWYQQKSEISKYFTIADIFTLPSYREVRGLVINEAMCFGLPILTTKFVGASIDLVREGENGYIIQQVNSKNIDYWLMNIVKNNLTKKNKSKRIIERFTIKNITKHLII